MPFGNLIVYVGGGLIGLLGIINSSSNNKKSRNTEKKDYRLAEKSMFHIDGDDKINGNYNIISNEEKFIIKNMNFVFKNSDNDIFILNKDNKWLIINDNNDILYESLTNSFLFPEGNFVNISNKKQIKLKILNGSLINKYKKLHNDFNIYNIKIDENIGNLLDNKNNIFLKSKIISSCSLDCSINIKNSSYPDMNGIYKSTKFQNKYGIIFKHINNNYWLAKSISLNKQEFNTKFVWCLSDESPLDGIYYKNVFYFSHDDILRIPENNMYDINNKIINLKSDF